jgi:PPOX class probable F420-dependent enzyme
LATVGAGGEPHVVPVAFALHDDVLWTAVDQKPKSTRILRRVENVRARPRVSVLVDRYEDDWSALWWVRADGRASVADPGSAGEREGLDRLIAKYQQYQADPPLGPVVVVHIETWRSWSATPT